MRERGNRREEKEKREWRGGVGNEIRSMEW